jgi:uncharacterized protein YjbI with pentapeptide repeats
MSNPDHLAKLLQGQDAWNAWRESEPDIVPDLSGAALTERAGIPRSILSGGLDLRRAMLQDADLSGAVLREADLTYACLEGADLRQADLSRTALVFADLSDTNLTGARLDNADLAGASLSRARLGGADLNLAVGLTNAQIRSAYCDLETQLPTYLDAADIYKDPESEVEPEVEDDPVVEAMLAADGEAAEAGVAPPVRKRPLNPYRVLEVTPQATALELRNAYLRLAKKYHPDVNPGDAEAELRFKDVNEAYRRAAARSRSKLEAKRGGKAKFWAAAAAVFLVSAIAASVAVYLISSSKSVGLHAGTAPESAPDGPKAAAAYSVREEAEPETAAEIDAQAEMAAWAEAEAKAETELAAKTETAMAEPGANAAEGRSESKAAEPVVLSMSSAKEDSELSAPEPATPHLLARADEHAPAVSEPASPAPAAPAPASTAANTVKVPDPGNAARVPSPPEREPPAQSINPAPAVTAEIEPQPSTPAQENTAPAEPMVTAGIEPEPPVTQESPAPTEPVIAEEKPAIPPAPQRMARLNEDEDKESELDAWQSTKEAGTLAAFRAYLINFPHGRHFSEAREHVAALESELAGRKEDEAAWTKAQRLGSRPALLGYLLAFPDGRYADEAKKKLSALDAKTASLHKEDQAWAKAKADNSHQAYANYLSSYPNGRYAAQAQQTIAAAQSRPRPSSPSPSPTPDVSAGRVDQASDDRQSRRSPRFPSSDEPFIERLPSPH